MNEFYFAGYRLLMDERLAGDCMGRLRRFAAPLNYTHTFTVREGDESKRDEYFARAEQARVLIPCGKFDVLQLQEGTAFYHREQGTLARTLLFCSADYGDMTAYVLRDEYIPPESGQARTRIFPFEQTLRHAVEVGIALRSGISAHAALVEHEGRGILFLGPSGMGKSTQARLWEKVVGADFISGDRPCLKKTEDGWYGFGMPWDGKDCLLRQNGVPLRAAVVLEQAEENEIRPMTPAQAMAVLLKQVPVPVWDRRAADAILEKMDEAAREIPFLHLKNRADENCVRMTLDAVSARG